MSKLKTPVLSSDQHQCFISQLARIMQCCGQWPQPAAATVSLLEPLVRLEMRVLTARAQSACLSRGSEGGRLTLKVEDAVTACSTDKYILGRLVAFFQLSVDRCVSDVDSTVKKSAKMLDKVRSHVARLHAQPAAAGEDHVISAQAQRLNCLTSRMSAEEYNNFSQLRNGWPRRGGVCKHWLRALIPPRFSMSSVFTDVMLFLMRDIVSRLVDACMLVVEDGSGGGCCLDSHNVCSTHRGPVDWIIQPSHVMEAIRRLQTARKHTQVSLIVR